MTHQTLYFYGLLSLLSLLILRGLYSLFLRIEKERSMSIDAQKKIMESGKKANRLTKAAILGVFCFGGGWMSHDLQQFHHTYVVTNVEVIDNANREQGQYRMAFGDTHQEFNTRFCPDYLPQFPVGTKLELLVYEDRGWCWSISDKKLGYKIQQKG